MRNAGILRRHEKWPDVAKGIGIILVVYGHVARGIEAARLPIDPVFFGMVDALIYAFHMPLFFFVSGYLMWGSISAKGHRQVTVSRTVMLLWLYLLWSVGHGSLEVLLGRFTNGNLDWPDVFALWLPRAHFWYLYALALMVLVAGASSLLPARLRLPGLITFSALLFAWPGLGTGWYVLLVTSWYLVYFTLGMLAAWLLSEDMLKASATEIFASLTLASVSVLTLALLSDRGVQLILALGGVFVIGCVAVVLPRSSPRAASWLAYLGSMALPIYLAHIIAGSGVRIVLQRVFLVESVWLHLSLGVVAAVLLPVLLCKLSTRLGAGWLWSPPAVLGK